MATVMMAGLVSGATSRHSICHSLAPSMPHRLEQLARHVAHEVDHDQHRDRDRERDRRQDQRPQGVVEARCCDDQVVDRDDRPLDRDGDAEQEHLERRRENRPSLRTIDVGSHQRQHDLTATVAAVTMIELTKYRAKSASRTSR